ncbi:MAG: T9SS type A sorting domain-containing protein [Bacteroidales bacterium]|jgi:hypothetical protein|nr:T9SS type A sorting domain-containing protein [Bacteroidales bacterium]
MKPVFFILIFLLTGIYCSAQTIEYVYDNAGNRTLRRIISMSAPQPAKRALPAPEEEPETPPLIDEMVGEMQVRIFPNPTKGILGIEIKGAEGDEEIALMLYGGQGALLLERKIRAGYSALDLSAYASGWYVLRLQSGSYRQEYKIVKE